MNSPTTPPPLWLRWTAALVRRMPPVRGRGRLVKRLHRRLAGHGWTDNLRVNGAVVHVLLDDLIGRTLYIDSVFERTNTAAVRALLKPGDIVFDGGANMGYYSLLFAQLVGPAGAVYAFEPVPETVVRLQENLALNPSLAARVRVLETALSDRNGTVPMNVTGAVNTAASHVATPVAANDTGRAAAGIARNITVPCRTGDNIWRELGRPTVGLIKLDIEGHEPHALRGMKELLSSQPAPIVMAEVRSSFLSAAGESRESFFAQLQAAGFGAYDFDAPSGTFQRNDTSRDGELIVFSRGNPDD